MVGPDTFIPQLASLPVTAALGAAMLHLAVGAAALAVAPREAGKGDAGGAGGAGGDWSGAAAAVAQTHLGCGICGYAGVQAAAAAWRTVSSPEGAARLAGLLTLVSRQPCDRLSCHVASHANSPTLAACRERTHRPAPALSCRVRPRRLPGSPLRFAASARRAPRRASPR